MAAPTALRLFACATALLPLASFATDDSLRRCRLLSDANARLACYDAIALPAPGSARAPAPAKETPAQFGLVGTQRQVSLDAVESRIPGNFEGWNARSRIALENGQVWQQVESGSFRGIRVDSPAVIIEPAFLGSWLLKVEGFNQRVRVRRIK